MNIEEARLIAKELVQRSKIAFVGSVDSLGFPNIKAMLNLYHEGISSFGFSTNTSSKRVQQFNMNKKSSIYFCDDEKYLGLLLVGNMEVTRNKEMRNKLWFDGSELFYPLGIDDPDYSVIFFTTMNCDLYTGKEIIQFDP